MKNILVVGAHYDDADLGAGGTMARFKEEGANVYKITLTDTCVTDDKMGLNIKQSDAKRNSKEACKILGVEEIEFETQPYGNFQYSQKSMRELERIIDTLNIDTAIYHFSDDYNTDHIAANMLCNTAFRHCKNTLMFQSNPYITEIAFAPNFFIDISKVISKKIDALTCYDKEHDRQGRLFETAIERNKIWGYACHVSYAEGFKLVKFRI